MTALARPAKRAVMDVVLHVAAVAAGLQNELDDILDGVAGVTVEPLVGSGQRVFGLAGVIEAPARPTIRVMTKPAVGPETTLVKLILVATGASRPGVLE